MLWAGTDIHPGDFVIDAHFLESDGHLVAVGRSPQICGYHVFVFGVVCVRTASADAISASRTGMKSKPNVLSALAPETARVRPTFARTPFTSLENKPMIRKSQTGASRPGVLRVPSHPLRNSASSRKRYVPLAAANRSP